MDTDKLQDQAQDKIDSLKTLNPKQRRAVGVLIGVVIVVFVAFGIFFAVKAKAETVVDVDCAKQAGYCLVSIEFLRAIHKSHENIAEELKKAKNASPPCSEKGRT